MASTVESRREGGERGREDDEEHKQYRRAALDARMNGAAVCGVRVLQSSG